MGDVRFFTILELRANNWYVNQAKLDRVREAWSAGTQDTLPPVLVTHIDGELSLIDGHARTFAAYEAGAIEIRAEYESLEDIEGSTALYEHIHREGPARGVRSIADLADRIVDPDDHRRLWIGYCEDWLARHETPEDGPSE